MISAPRIRAAIGTAGLVAGEVGAVLLLVRVGRAPGFALPLHHLRAWIRSAPTETLVAATARLIGLVLGAWLLLATVLSLARRLLPLGRAGLALDLATPRSLRRLLDRLVVAGLGVSLAVGSVRPAAALTSTSRVGGTRAVVTAAPDRPVPRVPPPADPPSPTPAPAPAPAPADPPARAGPATTTATVVVVPGDNLWLIARRALGSDRPSAIAPYWRALIAANVESLRSHDPNLIYPGERLVLPRREEVMRPG
ncbi:MAG TPA: LysM domain-containing protein [Acidimicrobiia bacterium]|nr:LysM domain-containing protein [Acidimicrobiia bacterium]